MKTKITALLVCLLCVSCWKSGEIWQDDTQEEFFLEEPTDNEGTSVSGEGNDPGYASCKQLSPCVVSDVGGYQCPGSVQGVVCWDFSGNCRAKLLCASTKQACMITCGTESCDFEFPLPAVPICS